MVKDNWRCDDTTDNATTTGATNMMINGDGPITIVVNQSATPQ